MLRRLHDADVVLAEQAERARAGNCGAGTKSASRMRDEVGRLGQRATCCSAVVDVAGLGVRVVGPRQVARAEARCSVCSHGRRPSSSTHTR